MALQPSRPQTTGAKRFLPPPSPFASHLRAGVFYVLSVPKSRSRRYRLHPRQIGARQLACISRGARPRLIGLAHLSRPIDIHRAADASSRLRLYFEGHHASRSVNPERARQISARPQKCLPFRQWYHLGPLPPSRRSNFFASSPLR